MATINLTSITVDDKELWSCVMGSGWETWDWWRVIRYADGTDWKTPGKVLVAVADPDDEDQRVAKTITVDDLARAVSVAIEKNYNGGLGHMINWLSFEDYDACASDVIMQIAVLGDVVYG